MSQNEFRGTIDPAKVEFHPIAKLFPMMEGTDFEELVEDIRKNGLRTPILLDHDGLGLDGRNRLRACSLAGVEPRFETWDGQGTVTELIVSLNLRRRHLNESQRAMLAARLKEKLVGENRNRLIPKGISGANLHPGKSADRAAALLNVSSRSVANAAKLLRLGDDRLIVLVESGKLAVSAAAEQADSPTENQRTGVQFPVLYAEPAWKQDRRGLRAAVAVRETAAPDAVLFLWAPNSRVPEAMKLLVRWGFRYEASMAWRVESAPGSRYVSERHDLLLIAVRGRAPEPAAPASTGTQSRDRRTEVFAMIERMFPEAEKANLSAAAARPGWTTPTAAGGGPLTSRA